METSATFGLKYKVLTTAFWLGIVTILYNLVEGGVSAFYGLEDETLALFGFGIDSFIEVISAVGVTHMILRMRKTPVENTDRFEKQALRITGTAFYILTAGLLIGSTISIITGAKPQTTLAGIVISLISIITMYSLYRAKLRTGKALNSDAIISDANCTKTCFYLSFILLVSSGIYEVFHIPYVDSAGGLLIGYYAWKEGREAFQKAKKGKLTCCDSCESI